MAFDLLLSRGAHLPTFTGPPLPPPVKARGLLARLFTKPPAVTVRPDQISYDAFHRIMDAAPAERRGEVYYVRHRAGGDPWFVTELLPQGYMRLSASHSYHAFPRNFGDMLDMGLRLTALVGAQLFTASGEPIVSADIARLLAPDAPFVTTQIKAFQAARARLDQGLAPLEYPRDGVDLVPDYFVFTVTGRDVSASELEQVLAAPHRKVISRGPLVLGDLEGTPLTKVRRDGAQWRVTSAWGAPFDINAHATFDVVEELAAAVGGSAALFGRVVDAGTRAQIRKRCSGLGMDFASWLGSKVP